MKLKEFVVLIVLIILLGTYLFVKTDGRTQYELPAVPTITVKDISRIEIAAAGNTVELTRSGDHWQIGGKRYPADETKVKNILEELETLKLTALVSEAKAYVRYDLSDEKKISVKAWAGDKLVRNFEIGKEADTYRHTFIRLADNPNVYQAQNNFRRTFDQTSDTLRDKTVLSFDTADIKEIQIASGDKNLTLTLEAQPVEEKKPPQEAGTADETADQPSAEGNPSSTEPNPTWFAEDGKPVPLDTVQRLLSQLAHLTCAGYLKDDQAKDMEQTVRTISLKGDQTYSLSIFEKGENESSYPATSSQNKYPFTLSESTWSRLTESLDPLFETEKAP